MRFLRLVALASCVSLASCGPMLAAMGGVPAGTPPQAPAAFTNISRTAIDFALNSFDAALYGLDFAMDAGKLQPGSTQARSIAAAGRKVLGFLGAADAAQKLGSSPTYEAAFANAKEALDGFRALLPAKPASFDNGPHKPMTMADRFRVIHRLEAGNPTV